MRGLRFPPSTSTAALACLFCVASALMADEPAGPFEKAAQYAQQRTVKIYGAGIGRVEGYASGVVVSKEGHIIAPQGVYLAGRRIRVVLADGTQHEAQVVRRQQAMQLALLQIDQATPQYFELSSEPVGRQGDWVLTVCNAFKVAEAEEPLGVSLGVISLRAKLDATQGLIEFPYTKELLLIDAITSNPGAAGGAVVTSDGTLAGVIGKPIESRSTRAKVSYAIPVDQLGVLLDPDASPTESETPERPGELGLRIFTLSGRSAPAYVDRVSAAGAAAKAGLRSDDLVVSLGGETIRSVRDFQSAAEKLVAGKPVEIVVKRGQKLLTYKLTPQAKESP